MALHRVGDRLDIVEVQHRQRRVRKRRIGCDGEDVRIIGMKQRLAHLGAVDLDLGVVIALDRKSVV